MENVIRIIQKENLKCIQRVLLKHGTKYTAKPADDTQNHPRGLKVGGHSLNETKINRSSTASYEIPEFKKFEISIRKCLIQVS